jgi:hypothetical protein
MMNSKIATLGFVLMAAVAGPAMAQDKVEPEQVHAGYREIGKDQDWIGIYTPDRGVGEVSRVCAIYSRPKESAAFKADEPVEQLRGETAAFINWNETSPSVAAGEVSFMLGAPVAEGAAPEHTMTIDGKVKIELVGVGDRVYVRPADDDKTIEAIRAGHEMVVTARLADDVIVKDNYSLLGVQATTAIASKDCK